MNLLVIVAVAGLALVVGAVLAVAGHRVTEVREIRERPADQPAPSVVHHLVVISQDGYRSAPREIPVNVTIQPTHPGSTR